jgi:hypothetical protein
MVRYVAVDVNININEGCGAESAGKDFVCFEKLRKTVVSSSDGLND